MISNEAERIVLELIKTCNDLGIKDISFKGSYPKWAQYDLSLMAQCKVRVS